jgi:hypothetical protein
MIIDKLAVEIDFRDYWHLLLTSDLFMCSHLLLFNSIQTSIVDWFNCGYCYVSHILITCRQNMTVVITQCCSSILDSKSNYGYSPLFTNKFVWSRSLCVLSTFCMKHSYLQWITQSHHCLPLPFVFEGPFTTYVERDARFPDRSWWRHREGTKEEICF